MASRSHLASTQVEALRALADELEAGTRELSPAMAKALAREIAREDDTQYEELAPDAREQAWADEIDVRLESYRAGASQKVDLGAVLQDLRDRLR